MIGLKVLTGQELTVFNVDFPTETTNVKFRTMQWICTETLLALAALLNFMPRKLADADRVSVADSPSEVLQMGLLFLINNGHVGLLLESHLAPHWDSQYLGVPDGRRSFPGEIQRHRRA